MEMERLNDNTIRVLLGNDDLAERGISMLDLIGNHQQIETFFYSILDEVDQDHTFSSDSAVTFQVMPSQNGLELIISRNKLNSNEDDDASFDQDDSEDSDLEDIARRAPKFIREQLNAFDTDGDGEARDEGAFIDDRLAEKDEFVLQLNSFEDFVSLAKELRLEGARSDLYTMKNKYYLVLTFYPNQVDPSEARDQKAIALEYGERAATSAAMLSEYGKHLMETSALETARYYFK